MLAFRMAFRSVTDNWRHSMATLMSIALGLCGVSLLQGYIVENQSQFADIYEHKSMYGQVIVEAVQKDDERVLIEGRAARKTLEIIKSFPEVDTTVRFMPIEGIAAGPRNSINFFGYAYDVEEGTKVRGDRWSWDTLFGSPLTKDSKAKVLVGRGLAENLGCDLTGQDLKYLPDGRFVPNKAPLNCFQESFQLTGLTLKGQVNAWDASISGIVDAGLRELDDNWLMMPISEAETFYAGSELSMVGVHLKAGADPEDFAMRLHQKLIEQRLEVDAKPWQKNRLAEVYRSNMQLLFILRTFILLTVMIVCAMSLMNSITRSIMERTREIGSLRAIGYERSFIVNLFGWEGIILGICGSLFGALLAFLLTSGINFSGLMYLTPYNIAPLPFRIAISTDTYIGLGFLLSLSSGAIASVVARLRTKQSIADALIS